MADGVREIDLQVGVPPDRPGQLQGATEQRGGGAVVTAPERPAAGRHEPLARPLGEAVVRLSQFLPVPGSLLQVVAEQLVELDQGGSAPVEPGGELFVQLGAKLLGDRSVDGIVDEHVHEAEAVLAREVGRLQTDEVAPDRTEQVRPCLRLLLGGKHRGDGATVKHHPLDRRSFEHISLRRREPVEAGGEQRLDRRR